MDMPAPRYYNEAIETADRATLNADIDERVQYTVRYAYEHSPFYRSWSKPWDRSCLVLQVSMEVLDRKD